MQNGQVEIIDGDHFEQSVVHLLLAVLPVPRLSASGITADVEEQHAVRPVGLQLVGVIHPVALDPDVIHQISPLLLEQIFPAFQTVEQEISGPGGEMLRIVVPGPVELQRDVGIDAHGEVIVEYVQRQLSVCLLEIGRIGEFGRGSDRRGVFQTDVERPSVQFHAVGFGDVDQHLPQRFVPIFAAPIEGTREIVAGAQRDDADRRGTSLRGR